MCHDIFKCDDIILSICTHLSPLESLRFIDVCKNYNATCPIYRYMAVKLYGFEFWAQAKLRRHVNRAFSSWRDELYHVEYFQIKAGNLRWTRREFYAYWKLYDELCDNCHRHKVSDDM